MEIISADSAEALRSFSAKIRDTIASHGVVAFPTDTVNGIGCSIYDEAAIGKLINIKGRDASKGLAVLVSSMVEARRLAEFDGGAERLAKAFWPGPFTMLLPLRDKRVNPRVAPSGRIAVRMPDNDVARAMADEFDGAVVGTSANESGKKPIDDFGEMAEKLPGIDVVVKSASARSGASSTIFDVTENRVVREGEITLRQIRGVLDGN